MKDNLVGSRFSSFPILAPQEGYPFYLFFHTLDFSGLEKVIKRLSEDDEMVVWKLDSSDAAWSIFAFMSWLSWQKWNES